MEIDISHPIVIGLAAIVYAGIAVAVSRSAYSNYICNDSVDAMITGLVWPFWVILGLFFIIVAFPIIGIAWSLSKITAFVVTFKNGRKPRK